MMYRTKDYFWNSLIGGVPLAILTAILIVSFIILKLWILLFVTLVIYIFRCTQTENVYQFGESELVIYYPRKILGAKRHVVPWTKVVKIDFLKSSYGDPHLLIEIRHPKQKYKFNYSSFMTNIEFENFVNEFSKRIGNEKVKNNRYGQVVKY